MLEDGRCGVYRVVDGALKRVKATEIAHIGLVSVIEAELGGRVAAKIVVQLPEHQSLAER